MARSPRTDHAPDVVHVAFDACDAGLVEALAGTGALPSFARLLREGRSVDTIAPYGTFVGSSWMTIATGTEVGTHGFFNWLTLDPRTYELEGTTPRDVVPRPYWVHAADAGARVAVLDVPHAGLPDHLDGVLLKEWGAHDRHDGTASHPPSLLEELDATLGRHPVGGAAHPGGSEAYAPCDYVHRADRLRTVDEERRLLDDLLHGIDAKLAATLRVLDQERWDLFTVAFGEGHCVGHQLWHVHDATHPRHDPAALAMLGDPVVQVYQRLDHALGTLLARCGPATNVLVQLNHGMGPHYDGDHLLDEMLLRIDRNLAGRFVPGWRTGAARAVLDHLPAPAARVGRRAIAGVVRHRADRHPPAVAARTGPRPDRRVLQVPGNTTVGAVRLNVRGREHAGTVAPGREEAALRRALADALREVVDIDSGRPLVRAVVDAEDVLTRRDGDRFPDLFVEWERASLVERVWSPRTGTVVVPYAHWRTGDHVDRGLVIATGPGVRPGRRATPMSLVDVAPSICAALDVPLPGAEGIAQADLLGRAGDVRHGGRGPLRAMVRTSGGRRAPGRRRPAEPVGAGAAAHSVATARRVDDLARLAAALQQRIDDTDRTAHGLWQRLLRLERERAIWTTMAWLARQEPTTEPLITIVTPTHERPEPLARAIDSVLAQRHREWELLVVDDGGESAKPVVAAAGDDRIRLLEVPHGGPAAARNAALAVAQGSLVTYLDDDNTLDPDWLHAVARSFAEHPEHDVLYGARLIDDAERVWERGTGGEPMLQFEPYDRAALLLGNSTDMGVVAHRAGHPAARFDESLWECADWDLFLALTEHGAPLEVPAIACCYRTDRTDRLTGQYRSHADDVRRKWAARSAGG